MRQKIVERLTLFYQLVPHIVQVISILLDAAVFYANPEYTEILVDFINLTPLDDLQKKFLTGIFNHDTELIESCLIKRASLKESL